MARNDECFATERHREGAINSTKSLIMTIHEHLPTTSYTELQQKVANERSCTTNTNGRAHSNKKSTGRVPPMQTPLSSYLQNFKG